MTEITSHKIDHFVNVVVWYRHCTMSRLMFFKNIRDMGIILKEVDHDNISVRDGYDARVFLLSDQEVIDMILPRII